MKKRHKVAVTTFELEKFQHFIFEMDDVLESFILTAAKLGYCLNYTIESLESLELMLLSLPQVEIDSHVQNRAARYLGEVFRKAIGGKWELCLKDPKYLFYMLPVISSYSRLPIEFCPIEVIGNFVRRKEVGLMKKAVEAHAEFVS